jgi:hypothetical protein
MREAEIRSLWSTSGVLINWMLIRAAKSSKEETKIDRRTSIRRSYRIGNQMRLPKQVLDIGQTTVGIHVSKSMNDTTATQIVVFHLPRGANRSFLKARIATSMPKTSVM